MAETTNAEKAKPQGGNPAGFFAWFPWEKLTIWALFLLAVYALRHFFFTIFMTFMITYIMRNVVRSVMRVLSPDTERTWLQRLVSVIAFVLLIGVLYGVGTFLFHPLKEQAQALYARVSTMNVGNTLDDLLRKTIGAWRFKTYYREKGDEQYKKDLEEFKKKYPEVAVEGFKKFNEDFDARFEKEVVAQEGEKKLQELRSKGRDEIDLFDWMMENPGLDKKFIERKPELVKEFEKQDEVVWIEMAFGKSMPPNEARLEPNYERKRDQYIKRKFQQAEYRKDTSRYEGEFKDYLGQAEFERLARESQLDDLQKKSFEKIDPKPPYTYEKFLRLRQAQKQNDSGLALETELRGGEPPLPPDKREEKIREEYQLSKEAELAKEVVNSDLQFLQIVNITKWVREKVPDLTKWVATLGYEVFNLLVQFVFSLLLSFLITFDLFRLRRGIQKLEQSSVRDFYREIAPGLINFGRLIGRSFQAQGLIALCNTLLTFILIKVLGIENPIFLASLVFLCSFIPVLGVVISSVPIAVVAITQQGGGNFIDNGFLLALAAVAGVLVVHFIETSILNPKILGDMLHLHPVMVLGILAVGEYFFGVWGLLLGVPVAVYIFRCVILGEELDFARPGARVRPAQVSTGPPLSGPPPAPPPARPAVPPPQPVGAGPK